MKIIECRFGDGLYCEYLEGFQSLAVENRLAPRAHDLYEALGAEPSTERGSVFDPVIFDLGELPSGRWALVKYEGPVLTAAIEDGILEKPLSRIEAAVAYFIAVQYRHHWAQSSSFLPERKNGESPWEYDIRAWKSFVGKKPFQIAKSCEEDEYGMAQYWAPEFDENGTMVYVSGTGRTQIELRDEIFYANISRPSGDVLSFSGDPRTGKVLDLNHTGEAFARHLLAIAEVFQIFYNAHQALSVHE